MEDKDISTLREQIADVDHVKSVIWYDSLADLSVPMDVLPDEIYDIFNNDESDSTLMAILFDTSMSADETMDAIEEIRGITTKQCYLSGMSAVVTDIKDLTNKERGSVLCIDCSTVICSGTFSDHGFRNYSTVLLIKYRNGNCI